MAVCDFQLMGTSEAVSFLMEIDGTDAIDETIEGNNLLGVEMPLETPGDESGSNSGGGTIAIISFLLVLISIAAFQLGPKSPKKEFERRK